MNIEILKKKLNNYLLCGGNFFSTKISCFLVTGLYFLAFSLTFAFSPPEGFLHNNKMHYQVLSPVQVLL